MQIGLGIGIGHNSRGGGASYVGPLDYRPGALGAWGLRKLYSAYEGPAVRARRSSDNAEMDIGFLADGSFDAATANTFKGAGTLAVVTLYDHSGNGRDFSQGTAANQPLLSADGPDGNWSLTFDGSNDYMTTASITSATANIYYFGVEFLRWENFDYLFDVVSGDQNAVYQTGSSPNVALFGGSGMGSTAFALDTWCVLTAKHAGASSELRRNKAAGTTGNNGGRTPNGAFTLGVNGAINGITHPNLRLTHFVWFAAGDGTATQDAVIDATATAFGISV